MRLYPLASSLVLVLALSACAEPEEVIEDVTWEPALDDDGTATITVGPLQAGDDLAESQVVTGTNNSDAAITFELICTFDNGGFMTTGCLNEQTVDPGASTVPVLARLSPNLPGEFSGSFEFIYDNETATFVVEGTVQ
jgi:hypothetical protein